MYLQANGLAGLDVGLIRFEGLKFENFPVFSLIAGNLAWSAAISGLRRPPNSPSQIVLS